MRTRIALALIGVVFGLIGLVCGLIGLIPAPGIANAGGHGDQMACMDDAITICGQFIPDRERVAGGPEADPDRGPAADG